MIILTKLQSIDSNILSYDTTAHIVQASAEGFVIKAHSFNTSQQTVRHFFVKYVEPKKYSDKPWLDLRRTVHYTRTEVRFYNEILPLLKREVNDDWPICPNVYLADYKLDGLLEEEETIEVNHITDGTNSASVGNYHNIRDPTTSVLDGKYGILVMDNVKEVNNGFQRAPLNSKMAQASVEALAKFHAMAFKKEEILSTVSKRLCRFGGSYHLKNRNPKEIKCLIKAWKDFIQNIRPNAPHGFFDDIKLLDLGNRVFIAAEYISNVLSPSPNEPFATIVHGDYKAMNIFFFEDNNETNPTRPLLIDFASSGVGLGTSDLAMHIAHAISLEDLENGMEELLFDLYFNTLQKNLPKSRNFEYSRNAAWRHYKFGAVDYFRFILGRQWNGVTPGVFEERSHDLNFGMINRSIDSALHFVKRVDLYLREIEDEMESLKNNCN